MGVMAFVDEDLYFYIHFNGLVNITMVDYIDDNEPRSILKQEDPLLACPTCIINIYIIHVYYKAFLKSSFF